MRTPPPMRVDPGLLSDATASGREARQQMERALTAYRDYASRPPPDPMRVGDDPRLRDYQIAMQQTAMTSGPMAARASAEAGNLARMAQLRAGRRMMMRGVGETNLAAMGRTALLVGLGTVVGIGVLSYLILNALESAEASSSVYTYRKRARAR